MSITRAPSRAWRRSAGALRADPAAREATRRWRRDTGGAPTLVACSAGADSTALALALGAAGAPIALGHIVHDMRPRPEAEADAERVRELAGRLGVEALVGAAASAPGENIEASLRHARYSALGDLARRVGAGAVASAHHADDQLESHLLALARGAGPRGLAGVAPRRPLAAGVLLVRPLLAATRADCERLCALAGVEWADDPTNRDTARARAALRHTVLPSLAALHPHAVHAASRAADLLRDAAGLIDDRVQQVFADDLAWDRACLRAERAIVVGEGLRRAVLRLTGGAGADDLGARRIEQAVRAIR
ncbi:MAG: tRNA lysidine(34) synthetase TilS [Phycisphaerales bacterium]